MSKPLCANCGKRLLDTHDRTCCVPGFTAPPLAEVKRLRDALEKIANFYVNNEGRMGGRAVEIAREALAETSLKDNDNGQP